MTLAEANKIVERAVAALKTGGDAYEQILQKKIDTLEQAILVEFEASSLHKINEDNELEPHLVTLVYELEECI